MAELVVLVVLMVLVALVVLLVLVVRAFLLTPFVLGVGGMA